MVGPLRTSFSFVTRSVVPRELSSVYQQSMKISPASWHTCDLNSFLTSVNQALSAFRIFVLKQTRAICLDSLASRRWTLSATLLRQLLTSSQTLLQRLRRQWCACCARAPVLTRVSKLASDILSDVVPAQPSSAVLLLRTRWPAGASAASQLPVAGGPSVLLHDNTIVFGPSKLLPTPR